jgi:hypothetical protein
MLVFEECEPVNAPYLSHEKDLLAFFLGILCSVEKRCKVRYRITTISRRANLVLHPNAAIFYPTLRGYSVRLRSPRYPSEVVFVQPRSGEFIR